MFLCPTTRIIMLKIIWTAAMIANSGPMLVDVVDESRFDTLELCEEFGTTMQPRMAVFVRGLVKVPWSHPVLVIFHCEVDGQPA